MILDDDIVFEIDPSEAITGSTIASSVLSTVVAVL
jgi:hypothetical protein